MSILTKAVCLITIEQVVSWANFNIQNRACVAIATRLIPFAENLVQIIIILSIMVLLKIGIIQNSNLLIFVLLIIFLAFSADQINQIFLLLNHSFAKRMTTFSLIMELHHLLELILLIATNLLNLSIC